MNHVHPDRPVPRPLGAMEYLAYLRPRLGCAVPESSPPVVVIMDWILYLAARDGADEVRFTVRPDDSLGVQWRARAEWKLLPPLAFSGSALSRLLVLAGLAKGEEARSRPQKGLLAIHGVTWGVETEPVGPWRENVLARAVPDRSLA